MEKNTIISTSEKNDELIKKIRQLESLCYQLKSMIDNVPSDVYWKDKDGVWIGLNKRCVHNLKHMGFIEQAIESEVIGKTDYQLFSQSTADEYRKNDLDVMSHKTEITIEEKTWLPTGEEATLLSTKKPMFDKNGDIIGLMGNTIDITYLKKIESELIAAKNAAEAGNRAKDEFIRNMSHDIRTPLSGIIGISSIMENELTALKDKEHAHMINVSGEQLLTLLNSVLDIIAMGSQKENQINLSPVNIEELIHNIAALELPTIKLKQLDLNIRLTNNLPATIETDAVKLHRILLNLLGNAVKFTEHGYIEIGANYLKQTKKKSWIEFYIKDTGPGIKEEEKDKIFKKFFRGTSSYQGIHTGYGVGLHIVKKYIDILKGKIRIESGINEGTVFIVSIPAKVIVHTSDIPVYPALPTTIKTNPCNHSSLNILLIEDNAIALKTAENILSQLQINFQSASNGARAIDLFKKNDFHLILTDIGLPDMSGFDITRDFRAIEQTLQRTRVPIIGLTAHSISDTEAEALTSGMNQIISKPLRLEHIQYLIKEYNLHFSHEVDSAKKKPVSDTHDRPTHDIDMFELEQFALFDEKVGINNCGGLQSLTELLVMLVNSELPQDRQHLQQAFEQQNFAGVEKSAHKIKGGAVYTGTIRMKFACQYLERYSKSGEKKLFDRLYHQAIQVIDETSAYLTAWLNLDIK